jgi:hypothetical protein
MLERDNGPGFGGESASVTPAEGVAAEGKSQAGAAELLPGENQKHGQAADQQLAHVFF